MWTHALLLSLLAGSPAAAETPTTASSPAVGWDVVESEAVTLGERVTLRSTILDDTVSMHIQVPASFAVSSPDHTYPVVFINGAHGTQFFSTVAGIVKHLGDRERMPESIVVSLDDLGGIPLIYTHGMWPRRETLGGSENAADYLEHLEHEVFPFLRETYRANDYRMLIGVSGSALFPIYTLTHAPDLFDSHILVAAAEVIGMGYSEETTFIDTLAKVYADGSQHRSKLYLGSADRDVDGRPERESNLETLRQRVGTLDALDLRVEVIPDEDHYAVLIRALLSALEQNFPDARWAARYRDLVAQPGHALENIDAYYAELSAHYGFTILPRADRWNNVNCLRFMIRHLVRLDRTDEAVDVARRRIEYRPQESASFGGLADALSADGQHQAAIEAQQQAVALAPAEDRSWLEERLAELQQAAQEAASQEAEAASKNQD